MKNLIRITILMIMISGNLFAQKYITKNGKISFYSDGAVEKIQATNSTVSAALDTTTGDIVFKVLIKSFEFEKALMQEHFNENYMESDKYPNSTFKGKVTNINTMNFNKNATFTASITGDLTIHGVTKNVTETGSFEIKDGKIIGTAKFNVKLSDYKVSIPSVVSTHIAESVLVSVAVTMDAVK